MPSGWWRWGRVYQTKPTNTAISDHSNHFNGNELLSHLVHQLSLWRSVYKFKYSMSYIFVTFNDIKGEARTFVMFFLKHPFECINQSKKVLLEAALSDDKLPSLIKYIILIVSPIFLTISIQVVAITVYLFNKLCCSIK
jgi:hypothetical protein